MAILYRAMDLAIGRDVMVKVLREADPAGSLAARFVEEAQITGQLKHPGIPPLHDVGTLPDGRPFFVLKCVRGRTLQELLDEHPAPMADLGRFVAVFEEAARTVAYAHARGVAHRDLKPANVLVGAFGEVLVMDWGLARVLGDPAGASGEPPPSRDATARTRGEELVGTPAYMAPEQARGDVTDCRSDVFGLGGVLCAILTGAPPSGGRSEKEELSPEVPGDGSGLIARLDSCGADAELMALAKRCLSPNPAARPADASEVAALVTAYRAEAEHRFREAEARRIAAEVRADERRKRRWLQIALAVALGLLVVACLL
jgi:serine/threonine protein kinase